MATIKDRLQSAWDAFMNRAPTPKDIDYGEITYFRPDRPRLTRGNERSVITAVLNRIAMDASAIDIKHVRLDENQRFQEELRTSLNRCLTLEANIDQTGRAFIHDVVLSMLDEGCVAVVPIKASESIFTSPSFKIGELRTGKIVQWHPKYVKVQIYNENNGRKEEILVPKRAAAIIENPMYAVMNEPNSTLQRLMRKLRILDSVDEIAGSGKLDMIIQLPYVIKSEARREQAEHRRKEIERQLEDSRYGIAYTDGTERIVQLNRSLDNNLQAQIEYLMKTFLSQLGITEEIMNGSADENVMQNYYTRIIEPILSAITDEMKRKFLTETARSQGQSIEFFRDPFKLMPTSNIAEIADKFTRNEIMTSNEIRQIVGMKPSDDPSADELRNKNLNQSAEAAAGEDKIKQALAEEEIAEQGKGQIQNGEEKVRL